MKKVLSFLLSAAFSAAAFSQKQTYDVLTFTAPAGWQKTVNDGGVQLSVSDKKTGGYTMAVITKSTASGASVDDNFANDWEKLVRSTVQVNTAPTMEPPVAQNGWNILSGAANYTDGASTGLVTLLSATGGGQTISVVFMTNAKQYQNDLLSFLNSLELAKVSSNTTGNTPSGTADNSSVAGLWKNNLLETSGYANGYPQYTAGYFRKEYRLNADGSYLFLYKNWSVYSKTILFGYETGRWSVKGNQLTITPKEGRNEEWNKAPSGRTGEWGSRIKSTNGKLEPVTYRFEMKYYSGSESYGLVLSYDKPTEREATQQKTFSYTRDVKSQPLIDLPPEKKINTRHY